MAWRTPSREGDHAAHGQLLVIWEPSWIQQDLFLFVLCVSATQVATAAQSHLLLLPIQNDSCLNLKWNRWGGKKASFMMGTGKLGWWVSKQNNLGWTKTKTYLCTPKHWLNLHPLLLCCDTPPCRTPHVGEPIQSSWHWPWFRGWIFLDSFCCKAISNWRSQICRTKHVDLHCCCQGEELLTCCSASITIKTLLDTENEFFNKWAHT